MRVDDFEYGFLGRVAADLQRAVDQSHEGAPDSLARVANIGALRGVVASVTDRVEALRESVRKEEARRTVYDRIREVLDERARYEREEGDREDARMFFEVDLSDESEVDDLLRHMERRHWSRECDEYAVVWATYWAHQFVEAIGRLDWMLRDMEDDGAAA